MILDAASLTGGGRAYRDVPADEIEPGAVVRVQVMPGTLRDRWTTALAKDGRDDFPRMKALLVAYSAIGEDGNRLFPDDALPQVGAINGIVLDRLYRAAFELNKLGGDAVEEAAKN